MSGILRLESLTKGNTLKQGDKTPLKYRLFDADGDKLNIAGKSAQVRLVYPDFLTIGYEKDGLTVAQDDTVTFTIDSVIPARMYHVEIIVDGKFIFPSREDEAKFTIDKSSLGTETSIIEIVGVDAVVRKAVDLINADPNLIIDEDKLVSDIISNTGIGSIEEYYRQFTDVLKELSEDKDYHSLPEISGARGGFNTLGERLNDTTTQLAQTVKKGETGALNLNVFDEPTRNVLQGQIPGTINAVLGDRNVKSDNIDYDTVKEEHISFLGKGPNLFNGEYITGHLFGEKAGGAFFRNTRSTMRSAIIKVEPNSTYFIEKGNSDRFRIAANDVYPTYNGQPLLRYIKAEGDPPLETTAGVLKYTLTTEEDEHFIIITTSSSEEEPELYVEKDAVNFIKPVNFINSDTLVNPGTYRSFDTSIEEFGAVGGGAVDDTAAIRRALLDASGKKIFVPPKTYGISGSLFVDSHTTLEGYGDLSKFILLDDYTLTKVMWRGSLSAAIILGTKTDSEDVTFRKIKIVGNKNHFKNERQYGLGIVDAKNVLAEDVTVEYINFNPELAKTYSTMGYSLGILRAQDVDIVRGLYQYGGYENLGTEDVDGVRFDGTYFGSAWRTSFQIHRGSKEIFVDNVRIEQDHPNAHSAFTLHGSNDNPVRGVRINGMLLNSITNNNEHSRGGIQTVEGNDHEVSIMNSKIHSSNQAVFLGDSNDPDLFKPVEKWKLIGNDIKGKKGIDAKFNNSIIKDNTIDAVEAALIADGENYIVKDNILIDNKTVDLTGNNFRDEGNV